MIEFSNISSHVTPLLKSIHSECDEQRKVIEEQAQTEIEAIRADAETRKKELWDSGRADLEKQKREITESMLKHARVNCDLRVKRKKSEAIERLLSVVHEKLIEFSRSDAFIPVLEQLITEAVASGETLRKDSPGSLGVLSVHPDYAAVAENVASSNKLNVSIEADSSLNDGVKLAIAGTKYSITNSLSSRLAKQENAIRMAIAERLNDKLSDDE